MKKVVDRLGIVRYNGHTLNKAKETVCLLKLTWLETKRAVDADEAPPEEFEAMDELDHSMGRATYHKAFDL